MLRYIQIKSTLTLSLKQTSRVLNGDVIIDFNATSDANDHYVFYDDALADSAYI